MTNKWEDLDEDQLDEEQAEEARRHKEASARRNFRRVYNGDRSRKSNRPSHSDQPSGL